MRYNKKLYRELRNAVRDFGIPDEVTEADVKMALYGPRIKMVGGTFDSAFFTLSYADLPPEQAVKLDALKSRIEADMSAVCCAINQAIMKDMQRFLDDLWEDAGVNRELRRHRYNKEGERDAGRYPFSRLGDDVKDWLREGHREALASMDWHSEYEKAWDELLEDMGFGEPDMEWEYADGLVQSATFTAKSFDFDRWLRGGRRMKLRPDFEFEVNLR